MEIAAAELDAVECYRLLVGVVVPRPIAWVTSLDEAGRLNAAPFSCYTFVCKKPPMICINIGRREDRLKDTATNIEAHGDFVVNVVTVDAAQVMHETSADYPPDVSEVEALGLETLPSTLVAPPRLAISPIHLECRLHQIIELGEERDRLVIGEVVHFHVRDELLAGGRIVTAALRPLARLGGPNYAALGEFMTMGFSSEFGGPAKPR